MRIFFCFFAGILKCKFTCFLNEAIQETAMKQKKKSVCAKWLKQYILISKCILPRKPYLYYEEMNKHLNTSMMIKNRRLV